MEEFFFNKNASNSKKCSIFALANLMVDVAQLVRVPDCGSVGRGFESHLPPRKKRGSKSLFFLFCKSKGGR